MNLLKKEKRFQWDQECKDAFQVLKITLATPSLLAKSGTQNKLIIYLLISYEVVSVAAVKEHERTRHPI